MTNTIEKDIAELNDKIMRLRKLKPLTGISRDTLYRLLSEYLKDLELWQSDKKLLDDRQSLEADLKQTAEWYQTALRVNAKQKSEIETLNKLCDELSADVIRQKGWINKSLTADEAMGIIKELNEMELQRIDEIKECEECGKAEVCYLHHNNGICIYAKKKFLIDIFAKKGVDLKEGK